MNSVTINLTRVDYAIGLWRSCVRHPVNVGAFVVIGLLMVKGQLVRASHGSALTLIAAVLLTILVCAVFFGLVTLVTILAVTLLLHRGQGLLGEHTFQIVERGLLESTSVNENLMKWGGVRSLSRTRRYIHVRVAPGHSYTIPRRHFPDAAADEAFWKALQPLVAKKNS